MSAFKLGKMTFGSLFKKPETILYPFQTKETAPGLKGHIENDVSVCILCGICSKRCPTSCIVVNKAQRTWEIDPFQCVQCGTCVRECPKHCLAMEPTYTSVAREKSVHVEYVPEAPKKPKVENTTA